MSATAQHPFGSPLGSSTKGSPVLVAGEDQGFGRTEFEVRMKRATGSEVDGYHFHADYIDRNGDLETSTVRARNVDEALGIAIAEARPYGRRFDRIVPQWSVVFLADGRFFDRRAALSLIEQTKEAV